MRVRLSIHAARGPALLIAVWIGAFAAQAQPVIDDFVIAVANDRADQVKRFLASGVDPNTIDRNGDPALFVAARGGNAATVEVLIAAKANVNARNRFQDTPLMVELLLANRADINHRNEKGASALDVAKRNDDAEMVARLRRAGARD